MLMNAQQRIQARYIPAGYTVYRQEGNSVVYASADHLSAIAYYGTGRKPIWFYRFLNEKSFMDRVNDFFQSMKANQERIELRQKEKKEFITALKPGDILYTSWGYEQTNVDFYQVINVLGRCTVTIREIASELTISGELSMQGSRMPLKDQFLKESPEMKKRVNSLGSGYQDKEYITMTSYSSAYPWDGKPVFCSWYG